MHAKEAVVVLSLVAFLPPEVGYSQEFGTGAIFLPPQEYNALRSAPAIIRDAPIPGNIDLADRFPSPGNQGLQASCVGWAVAYTKAYLENVERLEQGSSPVMYSPSFIFNQIKIDCFSGSYISDAVELIKQQGAVNIHEFVYNEQDCGRKPAAETLSIASRTKALNWGRIKNANETLETVKVQDYLIAGLPVIIGADIHSNFQGFRGSGVYNVIGGAYVGGHAMAVIGFDSQRHAYRLINSWGTSWGDSGYAWVDYDTMQQMVREAYVVFDESSENVSWTGYQQCLSAGGVRCCDHLSDNFSKEARLCTHIPGWTAWTSTNGVYRPAETDAAIT